MLLDRPKYELPTRRNVSLGEILETLVFLLLVTYQNNGQILGVETGVGVCVNRIAKYGCYVREICS